MRRWISHPRMALLAAVAVLPSMVYAIEPQVSTAIVQRAWTAREHRVKYAHFVWDEQRVVTQCFQRAIQISDATGDAEVTVTDIAASLGPHHVRYDYESINSGVGDEPRQRVLSVFDGKQGMYFVPSVRWHKSGTIGSEFLDLRDSSLRAVLLTFRALTPELLGLTMDRLELASDVVELRDMRCVLLSNNSAAGMTTRIWCDAERDFIPVRVTEESQGRLRYVLDMEFRRHEGEWIPSVWTAMVVDGTELMTSRTANVKLVKLNIPISRDKFAIEFPVDTRVANLRTGEEYVVMPNGRRQALANWGDEVGRDDRRWTWLLRASLFLAVVVFFAVCVRALRTRS